LNGKIPKLNELKEIISYKIGLNMVEKNPNQIVIKDLLDPKTISLEKTIKRMDNLIRILFTNLKDGLDKPVFCNDFCKEIYEVDSEINRIYFLILKLIKKSTGDPALLKHLEINQEKVLDIYWLIMNFEHIGDEIKRIAKFLAEKRINGPVKEKLTDLICSIEKNYLDTISAHLNCDKKFALEICSRKDRIIKKCDDLLNNNHNFTLYQIAERLKILEAAVHNISKYVAY
jgi:phosphate uptake regulator